MKDLTSTSLTSSGDDEWSLFDDADAGVEGKSQSKGGNAPRNLGKQAQKARVSSVWRKPPSSDKVDPFSAMRKRYSDFDIDLMRITMTRSG